MHFLNTYLSVIPFKYCSDGITPSVNLSGVLVFWANSIQTQNNYCKNMYYCPNLAQITVE